MPINPTAANVGAQLAWENAQAEAEIEQLQRQRQTLTAAATGYTVQVAERFRMSVQAAKVRASQADRAFAQAELAARTKIRTEGPSDALAKLWYEEATIGAAREQQAARRALESAELALGQQVEYRRALQQLEASAPGRRAAAEQAYQNALDQIDRELQAARRRCAD